MKGVVSILWLLAAMTSAHPTPDNTGDIAVTPVSVEAQPAQTTDAVPDEWPLKCQTNPCHTACQAWAELWSLGGSCSKHHVFALLPHQN
ncbi:hypothetical protein MCOR25_005452 [Pyricularia grisea]|nr:hypothetical protein MCOR25_005452 [Pyricularia grisea]